MASSLSFPCPKIAFEELSQCGTKDEGSLLDKFCDAYSLVFILFNSLGLAFKFAEMEYVAKVGNLVEASKRFATLENIVDVDIGNGTVKKQKSPSRDLRRVRQGLDLVRALFEQFLSSKYVICPSIFNSLFFSRGNPGIILECEHL
ncbi:hypothetical protein GOBAR_DD02409 [Gossypium barbadense]|nr:hypothetical protein GOBAR_DD02409 [Gossypium barbadense]